jgi:formate hydrogenlyase transcriptional activator
MDTISPREMVLRLDSLATQFSTTFLALRADEIGAALDRSLELVGEILTADTTGFFQFIADEPLLDVVSSWSRSGVPPVRDVMAAGSRCFLDRLARGEQVLVTTDVALMESTASVFSDPRLPIRSAIGVPVTVGGERLGALTITSARDGCPWDEEILDRVRLLAEIFASAIHRRRQERIVREREAELAHLATQLKSEAKYLREEIETLQGFGDIVGDSPALSEALNRVREVAGTDATVLLVGETGTGKELFARAVHERSPRRTRPLVRINCAALPPPLIESELFGHERGAFTGAVGTRLGRFELADKSTIFLDEIGDLPLELQAKLLRVLQEGEFERVGSSYTRRTDVRVIAATHRDLAAAVANGEFRADLYYRLSVFPIHIPALRERPDDIPQLVWFFVHRRQHALHRRVTTVPAWAMEALQQYSWPGNVRELENVIERALIRSTGDTLTLDGSFGQSPVATGAPEGETLAAFERRHIERVLRRSGWRINGKGNAAEQLNLHPNTLRFRMKKLGIVRPARFMYVRGDLRSIARDAGSRA